MLARQTYSLHARSKQCKQEFPVLGKTVGGRGVGVGNVGNKMLNFFINFTKIIFQSLNIHNTFITVYQKMSLETHVSTRLNPEPLAYTSPLTTELLINTETH